MKQKFKKISRIVLISCTTFLLSNCANDGISEEQKVSQANIKDVHSWFKQYESISENYFLLQNLDYNWDEAKITTLEDGTETVIVPVNELKKNQGEFWEQRLYIYKTGKDDYKALLYEIFTNKDVHPGSQSIDGSDFTGFMSVWDLKKGFVRAARFENNQVVETGTVEVVDFTQRNTTNKAPIEAPCIYSGADGGCDKGGGDTATPLREVIVYGPGNGTPVEYYGPRSPVIGGSDTGNYTSPSGGGSGSSQGNNNTITNKIVIVGPAKVITDIKEYLKCFNLNNTAQLIIYVDQPIPNNSDAYTLSGDVGHTFIAIQQGEIRRVLGYWPTTSVNPVTSPSDKKAFGNDENHYFDVSISNNITSSQLKNIINYCKDNVPTIYNLNSYNCTDFALAVGRLGGLNFSDSTGTWPGGSGNNPGKLGQNIRSMITPVNGSKQTTGGNAGSNKGTCN